MNEHKSIFPKVQQSLTISQTPHNNNISSKTNSPFSLKPSEYIFPKDIPLHIIYQSMIKEVTNRHIVFDKKIELNDNSISNRLQIISKMKKFMSMNHIFSHVIFDAIFYLDMLIYSKCHITSDRLAVGALILAIKFNELEINSPRLKYFHYIFNDYFYSIDVLLQIELMCLKQMNYTLNHIQPLHFLQLLLVNGIVFSTDTKGTVDGAMYTNLYMLPFDMLENVMKNINYIHHHPLHIACGCVALSRETYHLDKWNSILENITEIRYVGFELAYCFVKSVYHNKIFGPKGKKSYASVVTLPPTVSSSSASDTNDKENGNINEKDKDNYQTLKSKKNKAIEGGGTNISIEKYNGIKSNLNQFKAKSVEKIKKKRDEIIRLSSIKICKIQSTQRIKHDESSLLFNHSEIPPQKNRNLRANYSNIISKEFNRSCAMNFNIEKETNLNKTPFNFKDRSGSTEKAKKKLLNYNTIIPKSLNMTSTFYTNLMSNNIMSNRFTTKKIKVIDYKVERNKSLSKKAIRNTSMTKIAFNHLAHYKDKNIANFTRTLSFKSLRNKKTVIQV